MRTYKKILSILLVAIVFSTQFGSVFAIDRNTTTLITNQTVSTGMAYDSSMHVDSNGVAHVAWGERNEDSGEDLDVYYYESTMDEAIIISDLDVTQGEAYGLSSNKLRITHKLSPDDISHIYWDEVIDGLGTSDIFYYNSGTNQTLNVTNQIDTSGPANGKIRVGIIGNDSVAVWSEHHNNDEQDDVYVYRSSNGTTQMITDRVGSQGEVMAINLAINGSNFDVLWGEKSIISGDEIDIYHYSSLADETRCISRIDITEGDAELTTMRYLYDNDGVLHVAWRENTGDAEVVDIFHYNSLDNNTILLTDRDNTQGYAMKPFMKKTPAGDVFVLWSEVTGTAEGADIFLYDVTNSTLKNLSSYSSDTEGYSSKYLLKIGVNNVVYATWAEYTTSVTEAEDMFLYRSDTDTVVNITNRAMSEGYVDYLSAVTNSDGDIVVAWSEISGVPTETSDAFVYTSADGTTTRMSDHTISTMDVTYVKRGFQIKFNEDNGPIVFFGEFHEDFSNVIDLYMYDGGTGVTRSLQTYSGYGNLEQINNDIGYIYARQSDSGRIDVLWKEINEGFVDEYSDLFYYNTDTDTTRRLSPLTSTEGRVDEVIVLHDHLDRMHVAWVELTLPFANEGNDTFYYNPITDDVNNISDLSLTEERPFNEEAAYMRMKSFDGRRIYITWAEYTSAAENTDMFIYRIDLEALNPGFTVLPSDTDVAANEGDTLASAFTIVLNEQPISSVVIDATSTLPLVTLNTTQFTFDDTNWDIPQSVSITIEQDDNSIDESNQPLVFSINDVGSDDEWDTLSDITRYVDITDDDLDTDGDTIPDYIDPDDDNDGVSDVVEDAGPNSGDSNGDGILDSLQNNVVNLVSTQDGSYISMELDGTCGQITSVLSVLSGSLPSDSGYTYPSGLLSFNGDCSVVGGSSTVTLYFMGSYDLDRLAIRKYDGSSYTNVVGAVSNMTTLGGLPALRVEYTITDGGVNDNDGIANGSIVDPVGVGLSSGLPATGEDISSLYLLVVGVISMVVILSVVGYEMNFKVGEKRSREQKQYSQ